MPGGVCGRLATMPLIRVYTSVEPPTEEKAKSLLQELSSAFARLLGKPERYVMTCLVPRARTTFGGTSEPACLVEIKSIGGITHDNSARLSETACRIVHDGLGVPTERIYVVMQDVPAHLWGFDGATFG
jgi:phenylpyruvate tautomerase PptA (4-oxalocrotonate tautomerase family)